MRILNTQSIYIGILALLLTACSGEQSTSSPESQAKQPLAGKVKIDGSSTVFPISEAVAEEFNAVAPRVRVTVGVSGTGGGFKKFINKETDLSDASRAIKEIELEKASKAGIEFIELPVAYDGLSVVVSAENDWVQSMTTAELKKIWQPGSQVEKWNDIRAEWPDEKIRLYGPGTDSGTFDYFTKVINGKEQASRPDFTASEDDNVLVQGISGDKFSLGYFGYAYYEENRDKLKIVAIDGGTGPIAPSEKTINDGTYAPLSRPIFIYVNLSSLEKPAVAKFVDFYLEQAPKLVSEVGYIPLPGATYEAAKVRVAKKETGSAYTGEHHVSTLLQED